MKNHLEAFSDASWYLEDIIEGHIGKHDADELLEWDFEMPPIRKKTKLEENKAKEIQCWVEEDGTELSMYVEHNACIIELVCRPHGCAATISMAPMAWM